MIRLYDHPLVEDCYKVRLFLDLLGLDYELMPVDIFPGREQDSPAFRQLSPLGELPVLADGDLVLTKSQACLTYLALRHDRDGAWFPAGNAAAAGAVTGWFAVADQLAGTLGTGRRAFTFETGRAPPGWQAEARRLLEYCDAWLWHRERQGHLWFATAGLPSLADLALFPHIALAPEAGINLTGWRALSRWTGRVKALPRFSPMPGILSTSSHQEPGA